MLKAPPGPGARVGFCVTVGQEEPVRVGFERSPGMGVLAVFTNLQQHWFYGAVSARLRWDEGCPDQGERLACSVNRWSWSGTVSLQEPPGPGSCISH